jgi:hypothetical protein
MNVSGKSLSVDLITFCVFVHSEKAATVTSFKVVRGMYELQFRDQQQ